MEHVVFFTGPDGGSHFRRTAELEEAVRFVEHLRNVEGVEDSKVYALNEVPMNFRAYYRVEVPDLATGGEEPPADAGAGAGLVPDAGALTDAAAAAFAEALPPAAAAPPPPPPGEAPADGQPGTEGPRSLSFFSG